MKTRGKAKSQKKTNKNVRTWQKVNEQQRQQIKSVQMFKLNPVQSDHKITCTNILLV